MVPLELAGNKVAWVDDNELQRCNFFFWSQQKDGYVRGKVNGRTVLLHQFILHYPKCEIDHRNGNRADCRKHNLRLSDPTTNQQNSSKRSVYAGKKPSSQYKGVGWHQQARKWYAGIVVDSQRKHLGLFVEEIDAAKAYDKAAREYFGDFAKLNLP